MFVKIAETAQAYSLAPPPVDTVVDVLMRTDLSPEAIAAAMGRSGLLGAGPGMPAPAGELHCCAAPPQGPWMLTYSDAKPGMEIRRFRGGHAVSRDCASGPADLSELGARCCAV